jgi:hypothetical protein
VANQFHGEQPLVVVVVVVIVYSIVYYEDVKTALDVEDDTEGEETECYAPVLSSVTSWVIGLNALRAKTARTLKVC